MTSVERLSSAAIAKNWWGDLTSEAAARRGPRRAARARLRRAATPLEVIQEPEALRLIARLPGENPDRVAILAGVLALVDPPDDDRRVPRVIGRAELDDEKSALMSEGRFRRLLQTDGGDLMDAMRRLVQLTGRKANVYDLSFAVLRWGDAVKKRWIFEYYNVAVAEGAPPRAASDIASAPVQPDP